MVGKILLYNIGYAQTLTMHFSQSLVTYILQINIIILWKQDIIPFYGIQDKENLEKDIVALSEVLKSQGVGMDEPLVDDEGYPRADIDVYQVEI